MKDRILSVITNFGCHGKCPYCIVRENEINVSTTTLNGLNKLDYYLKYYNSKLISVSGGGDPLHNYDIHIDYYNKLFNILKNNNCKLEMHTSYINSNFEYEKCERVVYHLFNINQLKTIKRHSNEKVRVVFVVEENYTKEDIDYISNFCKESNNIDELSFRQMVDKNYEITYYLYDYLKAGHCKDWHYIEQCDYNIYYVEGKIYTEFSNIGK